MDLSELKRGEPAAIAEAARAQVPDLWRLARFGFLAGTDHGRVRIKEQPDLEQVESVVVSLLSAALTPIRRQAIESVAGLREQLLRAARELLLADAERGGRMVTLPDHFEAADLPAGIDDLDRIIATESALSSAPFALDPGGQAALAARLTQVRSFVEGLDPRGKALITQRFAEAKTPIEIARAFDCGHAAVSAHERRLRRRLVIALRTDQSHDRPRDRATEDALFWRALSAADAASPLGSTPSQVTTERIVRSVQTHTFEEEPAPYAERLRWALGAGAIALLLTIAWLGLRGPAAAGHQAGFGVRVNCKGTCAPGGTAEIEVRATKDMRRVAVTVADASGAQRSLLGDEGGSVHLPSAARHGWTPLPGLARLPSDLPAGSAVPVLAVFSRGAHVFTASTSLHLGGS